MLFEANSELNNNNNSNNNNNNKHFPAISGTTKFLDVLGIFLDDTIKIHQLKAAALAPCANGVELMDVLMQACWVLGSHPIGDVAG